MYPGPRFRILGDALRYVREQTSSASCAIKEPGGAWYRDPASGHAIFARQACRRRSPRVAVVVPARIAISRAEECGATIRSLSLDGVGVSLRPPAALPPHMPIVIRFSIGAVGVTLPGHVAWSAQDSGTAGVALDLLAAPEHDRAWFERWAGETMRSATG